MNVVVSWLRDFLDFDQDAEQLSQLLTQLGLEAAVKSTRRIPEGVVVAKVHSVEKHPNADKLSLCSVDPGDGTALPVVCGAPNVRTGLTVAFAKVGTALSPDFKIRKAKIRGEVSEGMICAEDELGISDEHSGVIELPDDCEIGKPLSEYIPNDETIEIDLTPNRGDCLSVLGVARDLSAKLGSALRNTTKVPEEKGDAIDNHIAVENKAPDHCPRYAGRLITGVKIGPSPLWLRQRLTAAGLRPINNVVDITNYILLHFGHPMHAFDYSRIAGKKIVIKRAAEGQTFVTLDEVERVLTPDDLLICDADKPVALAGVMGGLESGITEATTEVFLECAYFEPIGIRKTSKRVGLSSESSYRFERGVDYGEGLIDALDTAAEMIRQIAGGTIASGKIDEHGTRPTPPEIAVRMSRIRRLLGIDIPKQEVRGYLEALGNRVVSEDDDTLTVETPSFRHDLAIEADLIEEAGRLHGYDNIPSSTQAPVPLLRIPTPTEKLTDSLRHALSSSGFNEIVTNSMGSPRKQQLVSPGKAQVEVLNPLTPEMSVMRTSLMASMLDTIAYNLNRKSTNNRLFELGKTFEALKGRELPREREVVCIGIHGDFYPASWATPAVCSSFFVLKGIVHHFLSSIGVDGIKFKPLDGPQSQTFDEEAAEVTGSRGISGHLGKVAPGTLKKFDIKSEVFCAELDVTDFLQSFAAHPVYRTLPKYPAVERDFSFIMPDDLHAADVARTMQDESPLVESVHVFDQYRGSPLEKGTKSVAYAVLLRAPDRTLTDKDADEVCDSIVAQAGKAFGISLRS